ncbi:hypothetical protein [Thiohalorhabdus sp.]|uniref:hypothetical protein n=1 Tax=Thiohalorhabdus sp. TaxID=3094134 RepID=UPI002FC3641A
MVFRLIGLIGLTLLPLAASATEPALHQALGDWLADEGAGGTHFEPQQATPGTPDNPPRWLLHPDEADALNRILLQRGIFPEAVGLDWREEVGAVLVFGARHPGEGVRLLVDRDRQRPVELETDHGIRWRFLDYQSKAGRPTGLPDRVLRLDADGEQTLYTPSR